MHEWSLYYAVYAYKKYMLRYIVYAYKRSCLWYVSVLLSLSLPLSLSLCFSKIHCAELIWIAPPPLAGSNGVVPVAVVGEGRIFWQPWPKPAITINHYWCNRIRGILFRLFSYPPPEYPCPFFSSLSNGCKLYFCIRNPADSLHCAVSPRFPSPKFLWVSRSPPPRVPLATNRIFGCGPMYKTCGCLLVVV